MNSILKIRPVVYWLYTGCFLIACMVVVGGATRLTQSGLSMVDWHLFMGIIPPLNEQDWLATFQKYQQFPEYQKVNSLFSLEQFKSIFWWEYLHRLLGRVIGMVFIIPFLVFLVQKRISKALLPKLLFILFLGGFQGFLGWFMVRSGLVDQPHVSHFRLAIHLCAAFFLFSYTLWTALNLKGPKSKVWLKDVISKKTVIGLYVLLIIQIVYGAFVAGLKAGKFYNTYPKMDGQWLPDAMVRSLDYFGLSSVFNDVAWVQFQHRWLAVVLLLGVFYWIKRLYFSGNSEQRRAAIKLSAAVKVQFLLGVFTLLYAVPVWLGVLHQFGALMLLGSFVFASYSLRLKS